MKGKCILSIIVLSIILTGCTISSETGLTVDTPKVTAEEFGSEISDGVEELAGEDLARKIVLELNEMVDEEADKETTSPEETEEWY